MRRQDHYVHSDVNPMASSQMQHMDAERIHRNPGLDPYAGKLGGAQLDPEQRYVSLRSEAQWRSDGKDPKGVPNSLGSHLYKEGKGPEMNSLYQGQKSNPKPVMERMAGNDLKSSNNHEQDMEIGYEDAHQPQSLEALHQKFLDEIMKLMKEEDDMENVENALHLKRLKEIDDQYQEKLSTLREQKRSHLEGVLRKEAQMHHEQYQRSIRSQYQQGSLGAGEIHNYGGSVGEDTRIILPELMMFIERKCHHMATPLILRVAILLLMQEDHIQEAESMTTILATSR